jgi:hypothetical protein
MVLVLKEQHNHGFQRMENGGEFLKTKSRPTGRILDMNSKDDYTTKDTLKGNIWDANWTVNIDHQHNEVQIFTDEKVNYTWFFTIGTITPENELIARLIVAAPKMLKFFMESPGRPWNLEFLNEIRINAVPVKKITES